MGFGVTYFGFNPENTAASDFSVFAANPGIVLIGGEVNGEHVEIREVTGALWEVINAQFVQSGGTWQQINTALASYARVLNPSANVPDQILWSPALGGTLPTITWQALSGPVGKLASQPGVPASGTPLTNTTLTTWTVYVNANSLTALALGGNSVGWSAIPAQFNFRLPVGLSVTLTYAGAAPTWVVFGG